MTFKIRMDISEEISGKYYTVMVNENNRLLGRAGGFMAAVCGR